MVCDPFENYIRNEYWFSQIKIYCWPYVIPCLQYLLYLYLGICCSEICHPNSTFLRVIPNGNLPGFEDQIMLSNRVGSCDVWYICLHLLYPMEMWPNSLNSRFDSHIPFQLFLTAWYKPMRVVNDRVFESVWQCSKQCDISPVPK